MKKSYLFAFAAAAAMTVSCSNDELVNEMGTRKVDQTPIGFNVQKQNITRAQNLETVKHYNFGVWAWKVQGKNGLEDQEIMDNYLVGYSNETDKIGYEHSGATTWAAAPGETSDHTSPWIYEGLGTAEYTYEGNDGFYKKTDTDYMSKNANQYLRYWDLAYEKTNFYCYAPYNKNVTFEHGQNGTSTMTFDAKKTIRDGYDLPHNTAYNDYSRTLGEFMYATEVQSTNANLADVTVPFKHMGAQLFIRFYENIPGYKVEIIELNGDHGKTKDGLTGDILTGIQATPAVANDATTPATYSNGFYYTTSGATITFNETNAKATYTPSWAGSTKPTNTTPLMFKIPSPKTDYETHSVAPGNLKEYQGLGETKHNIIPEAGASPQTYAYSPTIYYPVAQPTSNDECTKTGFTFHISYRIIAEDNKEVITVHNATVHVPYKGKATTGTPEDEATEKDDQWITIWQPNVKYTYTFKFTRDSNGTTNPGTEIDPTSPAVDDTKSLYPIVFDAAEIEEWQTNESEYIVSEGTSY